MNLTDTRYKNFALIQEMLQTPELMTHFDFRQTKKIAETIRDTGKLFLTGEGSGRIFPAKGFIDDVRKLRFDLNVATEGCYQAMDCDLSQWTVCVASNSGQTKETIALFSKLKKESHQKRIGITSNPDAKLVELSNDSIVLSCGKEKAVAATKSVVEQALVYRSILCNIADHAGLERIAQAAAFAETVLNAEYDSAWIEPLSRASMIYFAGRNNGVAEELTLKTNEITRKKSDFLEGTYLLHGVEEIMNPNEAIVLVDPFESEWNRIKEIFVEKIGMTVVAIASKPTIFPTIEIPTCNQYDSYLQLFAGWNLLVQIGVACGVNLDQPQRARKIGNAYEE
jgi:glucosamine--fructose-6-phosphate aminotransferase (isomerizing)